MVCLLPPRRIWQLWRKLLYCQFSELHCPRHRQDSNPATGPLWSLQYLGSVSFLSGLLIETLPILIHTAVHHYISAWYSTISTLATQNSSVIHSAAQPIPISPLTDSAAYNISVDDALTNLILKDGFNNQTAALMTIFNIAPWNASYSPQDPIDIAALATRMQLRLNMTLAAVQSNVSLFLDLASNGTFSTTNVPDDLDLVATLCSGRK